MTLALVGLVVLAVVIFAFVLEPIVRARSDQAVLDAAVLPEHDDEPDEVDTYGPSGDEPEADGDKRTGGRRVAIERPASSDVS